MDKELLVEAGHALVRQLDETDASPSAALWINKQDTDIWRLWITPRDDRLKENDFFRIVAKVVTASRNDLHGLDIGDVELIPKDHPALTALSGFIRAEGLGSVTLSGNMLNGFYLPDGIVLRLAI